MKINYLILIIIACIFIFISQPTYANYKEIKSFGSNPGQLTADIYLPQIRNKTLVVLLHGCVQHNKSFAKQSGFESLAEKKQFLLLIPQQNKKNNIKSCFNWFSEEDIDKNSGESLSIYNMIQYIKSEYKVTDVNILGLSAGGAMASVMLSNYPETFTNGAIIAGLPYGCAIDLIKAIACMKSGPEESISKLTSLMINNHDKNIRWPNVSIWYGKKDTIVNPVNAQFMAHQWIRLNNEKLTKSVKKSTEHQIIQWIDNSGKTKVQLVQLDKLTHGMPVKPNKQGTGGTLASYVLQSPIASGIQLTNLWGL